MTDTPTPAPAPMTARLRELMEEATPGEWMTEQTGGNYGCPIVVNGGSIAAVWPESMLGVKLNAPANAALIVTLVNNTPTILRLLEAVEGAEKALEFIAAHKGKTLISTEHGEGYSHGANAGFEQLASAAEDALATLRAAREVKP